MTMRGFLGRGTVQPPFDSIFDERLVSALELIDAGEPGVALEILAQNLFEFDVPMTRAEFLAIEQAGTAMRMAPGTWTFLEELVTPATGQH